LKCVVIEGQTVHIHNPAEVAQIIMFDSISVYRSSVGFAATNVQAPASFPKDTVLNERVADSMQKEYEQHHAQDNEKNYGRARHSIFSICRSGKDLCLIGCKP